MTHDPDPRGGAKFDYIIVGSGAGGAPLAARLAESGCSVLVIEAGGDHGADAPTAGSREVSEVPSLHAVSTEKPELSWQFFVKHYTNPPPAPRPGDPSDPKDDGRGIFYPRAAALGGCTIHNAMITIAGPDSDWDGLADFLGDDSWRSEVMRPYFQKLERNEYLDRPDTPPTGWWGRARHSVRWLVGFDPDYTGGSHGFDGWLRTSVADLSIGLKDLRLIWMLRAALKRVKRGGLFPFVTVIHRVLLGKIKQTLDPNHARTQAQHPEGLVLIPIAVCGKNGDPSGPGNPSSSRRGHRSGPREFLLETQRTHPNLVIRTHCLVTEIIFNQSKTPRAVGVKLLHGEKLYEAHPHRSKTPGRAEEVFVKEHGEVILCGGSFNSPQLLMLSGLGDRDHLKEHGITCRHHLPGVGANLQDRYEVTVISEMKDDFVLLKEATFTLPQNPAEPDPALRQWRENGTGLYSSNGSVVGILKRSRPDLAQPDLFIFGIPLPFEGYAVGYSDLHKKYPGEKFRRLFTWAILKGHTTNHAGTVRLRSRDPLKTPEINFHSFREGSEDGADQDPDVDALVDGVKFVRGIAGNAWWVVRDEFHPGRQEVPAYDDARLRDWIRRVAWGHHACGTCRMGPAEDPLAVLDSRFRVRGVDGLRVVDASIFPKIPGYFIVTNIYIASEKAADVILADARQKAASPDTPVYPRELRAAECGAIEARRKHVRAPRGNPDAAVPAGKIPPAENWPADVAGLALSGGGIRSATMNLGVLQAMAKAHCLRRFDFLSTVSGGGYIGSFLGRFFDRLRDDPLSGAQRPSAFPGPDRVEEGLASPDSREIAWLRKHGNYMSPSGTGDAQFDLAVFLRNLLSVHFVTGALIFALFGLANAVRYGLFDKVLAAKGLILSAGDLPIGHLVQAGLGAFWSPWFVLFELLVLFAVLPRMVGYWMASQDEHERYHWPALVLVFLFMGALFFLGLHDGLAWEPLFLAGSLLSAFVYVEIAWWRGRKREAAIGTGGVETQRLRTRNYLTYDLGLGLALAAGALGFALIDTAGHAIQQWVGGNGSYALAFARLGAGLAAVIPIARTIANLLAGDKKNAGPPSTLARIFRAELTAGLTALVLLTVPLVLYSFASHAVYRGGDAVKIGLLATLGALVISVILSRPAAFQFVNRSSLSATYAARLARAYLGASNPLRHHPQGANVTEVMAGDDVPSIRNYQPHQAGGPLHLINVTVNQTVDFTSQRGNRDRHGENMAVSWFGVTIGRQWHSAWADRRATPGDAVRLGRSRLEPVGHVPGTSHPLLDVARQPTNDAETLSLRQWIGISGAAIGPGQGQNTALGTALLFGLANLRTGYWWDSGISESARSGFPALTFLRRLLYLVPRAFITQALLVFECAARFPGPWEEYWNISDGGFFENLAAYELIRRRVPRIVVCDGGADPSYQLEDLANLMRKVRIDFHAEIKPFAPAELAALPVKDLLAVTLDELKPAFDAEGRIVTPSRRHAALFWVSYPDGPDGPEPRSVLLYCKATVTGDESADIGHYHATHPEFPHEDTGDQCFDEAQWESYRQLGEHSATPLFRDPAWFWSIRL